MGIVKWYRKLEGVKLLTSIKLNITFPLNK